MPVVQVPYVAPETSSPREGELCRLNTAAQRPDPLTRLHAQSAEVAAAIALALDFATPVHQRQPAQLDPWLTRATTSPLETL